MSFIFAVKNRCESLGCWPLCMLTPDGGKCMCPDRADFLPDSTTTCDAREFTSAHSQQQLVLHCLVNFYSLEMNNSRHL